MYPTIKITQSACESAADLAKFIQNCKSESCGMLELDKRGCSVHSNRSPSRFLLFWASPTANDGDLEAILGAIPMGTGAVGCSTDNCTIDAQHHHGKWCAVMIESLYLTAYASFGEPSQSGTPKGLIDGCVEMFVNGLPRQYFRAGKAIGQVAVGGHE